MARLASSLLPYVFAILPIFICGFEFQNTNKKYCPQHKSNVTFGHRKANDTLLLQHLVLKKGIPDGKTSSKMEWYPQNILLSPAELRPTFINVVDKNKLCGCNNTIQPKSIDGSSKNFTGLEIFASLGCPINTLIELWGKNETKSHAIGEEKN